jgi:hypothetical protein
VEAAYVAKLKACSEEHGPSLEPSGAELSAKQDEREQSSTPAAMVASFAKPVRRRSKAHLAFVASQPCVICEASPCDAHHLKIAQPRSLGRKVSDEFTVPLCRTPSGATPQRQRGKLVGEHAGRPASDRKRALGNEPGA